MPAAPIVGAVASIGAGVAAGVGTLAGGLMVAGGVASLAGQVTGNKTLQKIGGVASLAGGGIAAFKSISSGGGLFGGGSSAASSAASAGMTAMETIGGLGNGISAGAAPGLSAMGGGAGISAAGAAGGAISNVASSFANAAPAINSAASAASSMADIGGLGDGLRAANASQAIEGAYAGSSGLGGGIQPNLPSLDANFGQNILPPPGMAGSADAPSTGLLRSAYGGSESPAQAIRQDTAEGGLLRRHDTGTPQDFTGNGIRPPGTTTTPQGVTQTPSPFGQAADATAEMQVGNGSVTFRGQEVFNATRDANTPIEVIKQKVQGLGGWVRDNKDLLYILNQAVGMAYKGRQQQQQYPQELLDVYKANAAHTNAQTEQLKQQQINASSIPTINMAPVPGASPFGGQNQQMPAYMRNRPGLLRNQ